MFEDSFSKFNPLVTALFFAGVLVFTMAFSRPAYLVFSLALAVAYYLQIKGLKGFRLIGLLVPLVIMVILINPLFNTNGSHILFEYAGGRPYTMEALEYGIRIGIMFAAIIIWSACSSNVMTKDKFIELFGGLAPSLALVLTMTLSLLPDYMRKGRQINAARSCIGKAGTGSKGERIRSGMLSLSALTSWGLEAGVITAGSMNSRGYGTGRRTSFGMHEFVGMDYIILVVMAGLVLAILALTIIMGEHWCGLLAYVLFLSIPTVCNLVEGIRWHLLKSEI